MRPEFGCAVHDLVFDTIDAAMVGKHGDRHPRGARPLGAADRGRRPRLRPRPRSSDGRLLITISYRVRTTNNQRNLVYPFYVIPEEEARHRRLFEEVTWSTDLVAEQTLARAAEIGLSVHLLPAWYDVDDAKSLSVLYGELFEDRPFSRRHDRHHAASSARLMHTLLARSDLAARLDIVPRPAIAVAAG